MSPSYNSWYHRRTRNPPSLHLRIMNRSQPGSKAGSSSGYWPSTASMRNLYRSLCSRSSSDKSWCIRLWKILSPGAEMSSKPTCSPSYKSHSHTHPLQFRNTPYLCRFCYSKTCSWRRPTWTPRVWLYSASICDFAAFAPANLEYHTLPSWNYYQGSTHLEMLDLRRLHWENLLVLHSLDLLAPQQLVPQSHTTEYWCAPKSST